MLNFKISGQVFEAETRIAIAGCRVRAFDKDVLLLDDALGTALTDDDGRFTIVTSSARFVDVLEERPDIYLQILDADTDAVLYSTENAIKWNAGPDETCDVIVPREALGPHAPVRDVELIGDDGLPRAAFEVGEPLGIRARGLAVASSHEVSLFDENGSALFTSRLMSDRKGTIRHVIIWSQLGIDDPRSNARLSPDEALTTWGSRQLRIAIARAGSEFVDATIPISSEFRRPLVMSTDGDGRPRNGAGLGDDDLIVSGYNLPPGSTFRVWLAARRFGWRAGNAFQPVISKSDGSPLQADVTTDEAGRFRARLARLSDMAPGGYDFILRELRYGREDAEDLVLRIDDTVGFRAITGFRLREDFLASKFGRGGVNLQSISGRPTADASGFQFSSVFQPGEEIWGALEPSALDPEHQSKMVALYLVPHKSAGAWSSDPSLEHHEELGGNAAVPVFLLQSGSAATNMQLLWPSAIAGEYDIIADFGNNMPNASDFVPDASFDQPLDVIDGYVLPGFRVVDDPAAVTDFEHVGSFSYDETAITVTDEVGPWDPYLDQEASFSDVSVPVRGVVYFPADGPDTTQSGQISTAKSSYPIFVAVHGNSSDQESYLGYNYLLEHIARNGFIAASIYLNPGMHARGRAEMMFHHLDRLKAMFGTRAADRIAIMGHSRGGEAVVQAVSMSLNPAIDHNIEAVISLAPTDRYGRPLLGESAARPYLVIYGALDGDVAGAAAPGGVTRRSGFSLYDRAYGAPKSMVFVYGALHGPFNTVWGSVDSLSLPAEDSGKIIPQAAHRAVAQSYINAFLRRYVHGDTRYDGVVKGDWVPASVQQAGNGNVLLYVQYNGLDRLLVDNMIGNADPDGWSQSTIGGTVEDDDTLPEDPVEDWLHEIDDHSPHESGGLLFRWNDAGDRLRFELPAARDISGFDYLSFRVTQTVGSVSNMGAPQDFYVSLTDQGGGSRDVRISRFADIPVPFERQDKPGWDRVTKSAMRTIRIPLDAFTIAAQGLDAVDLTAVTRISFQFGVRATGEIAIDTVAFTDGSLPPGLSAPQILASQLLAARPLDTAELLPDRPMGPDEAAAALSWEAKEVVRDLNGRPHLFVRLTLRGFRPDERALEPIVRVGNRVARITRSGLPEPVLYAYFDEALPEGEPIDFGFESSGVRRLGLFSGLLCRLVGRLTPSLRSLCQADGGPVDAG
jgi:hypothetical protein